MKACHYCGEDATTGDHIVPRYVVRKVLLEPSETFLHLNVIPACLSCNQEKGDDFPTCPCERCRAVVEMFWTEWGLSSQTWVRR